MLPKEQALTVSIFLFLILAVILIASLLAGRRARWTMSTSAPESSLLRPPKKQIMDPSLRTHTKPLKVDVDLVLVPVTITDPMNRLVTGLGQGKFHPLRRQGRAGYPAFFQ